MMKRPRILFSLVLFAGGLAVGVWLGHSFGGLLSVRDSGPNGPEGTVEPPLPQRNLLVVGVDRAGSTKARLQAVWHVAYLPEKALASFIPLYPMDPVQRRPDSRIEETFRLRSNGELDPDFLEAIQEVYNLEPWDGLVLVDDIAMMQVVEFMGGVQEGDERIGGVEAVGKIPLAWVDPRAAEEGQRDLIGRLCSQVSFEQSSRNYSQLLSLMPEHMMAFGIDPADAIQDWLRMISNGTPLKCEFPVVSTGGF